MRKRILLTVIFPALFFIACDKEACDCDIPSISEPEHYILEIVEPNSYSIYTHEGLKQEIEPFDTLIEYYYYQNLASIDSILFSGENNGEFYTHSNRMSVGDTYIYKTSFTYSIVNNVYTVLPNDLSSTLVIDESQDDYMRVLTLGTDDEEIAAARSKLFEEDGDKLITMQCGVRIVQNSSTYELTVNEFNESALAAKLQPGEALYIMRYRMEYLKVE